MSEFFQEVADRKRLVRSFGRKRCGSKSKKCTLRTDNMTNKQIERMSGPVQAYKLNAPISWETFKTYPDEIKAEYLRTITSRYRTTQLLLSEMFGVTPAYLSRYLKDHNLSSTATHARGRKLTEEDTAAWSAFVSGEQHDEEVVGVECEENSVEDITDDAGDETPDAVPDTNLVEFTLTFDSYRNIDDIANYLRILIDPNTHGALEIRYKKS